MKTLWHKLTFTLALIGAATFVCAAQQNAPAIDKGKADKSKDKRFDFKFKYDLPPDSETGETTERAIETDAKVNVSFCVAAAELTVRGWERNEVRVMVENGSRVNFKIKERNEAGKPVWMFLQNADARPNAEYDECIQGRSIEVEMPYTAAANVKSVKSNGGVFTFDSIAKVNVSNLDADVQARNITQEIAVSSWQGSISAEDSAGKISLKTIGGDIAAYRLKYNDFSDVLKISSTSGAINLRDVKHKNIEAVATSGELVAVNSLVTGGNYDFSTTTGTILLWLPADFSFQFNATLSAGGDFQTTFPIKPTTQTIAGQTRRISGTNGAGDTTINLTSFKGVLWLKKK